MSKVTQAGRFVVQVGGASGATLMAIGASGAAISAATIIAATAGGAAVVLIGWGVYKALAPKPAVPPLTKPE
jgi:hypothetical protein